MISSIGFIPVKEDIVSLQKFEVNEDIKNKLSYIQMPIIKNQSEDDQDEIPIIKQGDGLLFCTPNTEEISNLAFYGYDNEEMFFHHDAMVFSTILDSCYLENCTVKDTLIAVGTFEPDIFIYDATIDFPILPQALLEGHSGPVTSVKNVDGRLLSASEDNLIIEWDLNTLKSKNTTNTELSIENMDFSGNNIVISSLNQLKINDQLITLPFDIENLKIYKDLVYATDSEGLVSVFDIRMPEKPMFTQQIHDSSVTDFIFVNDIMVTSSLDRHVKTWNLDNQLVLKNDMEQDEVVFSLGYNPYDSREEVFCGNADCFVYPLLLSAQNEIE